MADIPLAAVKKIRDEMTAAINAAEATPQPPTPPPPTPTPTPGASPEGTTIKKGGKIVDASGHVWTFGAAMTPSSHYPGPDNEILRDGQHWNKGGAQSLKIEGNVIFAITANRWGPLVYKDAGTSWSLVSGTA